MAYKNKDLSMTNDGDLEFKNGDLAVNSPEETIKQHFYNRLNTNDPEWVLYQGIGSNLEDMRGKRNTQETGMLGEEKIEDSLTYGNLIDYGDLDITTVPSSAKEISYFIKINDIVGNNGDFKYKTSVKL